MRGREARIQIRHQRKKLQEHRKPKEIRLARDANFSNGIDLSVYSRMWIRDTDGIDPLSYNGSVLRVPHTIVFLHGAPAQWYFTSKVDGKYLRRKKKES